MELVVVGTGFKGGAGVVGGDAQVCEAGVKWVILVAGDAEVFSVEHFFREDDVPCDVCSLGGRIVH